MVNTTPKPRATKKSKGEEPEFPPLPALLLPLSDGDEEAAVVDDGRVEEGNEEDEEVAVAVALSVVACLTWWCSARTAKLAIPAANSELSKTMANRLSPASDVTFNVQRENRCPRKMSED